MVLNGDSTFSIAHRLNRSVFFVARYSSLHETDGFLYEFFRTAKFATIVLRLGSNINSISHSDGEHGKEDESGYVLFTFSRCRVLPGRLSY